MMELRDPEAREIPPRVGPVRVVCFTLFASRSLSPSSAFLFPPALPLGVAA